MGFLSCNLHACVPSRTIEMQDRVRWEGRRTLTWTADANLNWLKKEGPIFNPLILIMIFTNAECMCQSQIVLATWWLPEWPLAIISHRDLMRSKMANFGHLAAPFRTLSDRLGNQALAAFTIRHFQTLCRHYFSGEPVVIGITMYVLSISSVEEVQMVLTFVTFFKISD